MLHNRRMRTILNVTEFLDFDKDFVSEPRKLNRKAEDYHSKMKAYIDLKWRASTPKFSDADNGRICLPGSQPKGLPILDIWRVSRKGYIHLHSRLPMEQSAMRNISPPQVLRALNLWRTEWHRQSLHSRLERRVAEIFSVKHLPSGGVYVMFGEDEEEVEDGIRGMRIRGLKRVARKVALRYCK